MLGSHTGQDKSDPQHLTSARFSRGETREEEKKHRRQDLSRFLIKEAGVTWVKFKILLQKFLGSNIRES